MENTTIASKLRGGGGSASCKSAQDKGFRWTLLEYIKRFDFFKSFSFAGANIKSIWLSGFAVGFVNPTYSSTPLTQGERELCCTPHSSRFTSKKAAFTLAEVLITLGIIGIVAAMTIPGLVGKYKDKVMITQTKKTYATVLSVLDKLKYEMGASDYVGVFQQDKTEKENANLFFSKFKTLQICDRGKKGCTVSTFKYPSVKNDGKGKNGSYNATSFYRGILPDGSVVGIHPYVGGDSECGRIFNNKKTDADGNWISDGKGGYETVASYSKQCGVLMIDANGIKAPNQLGADVFFFIIGPKKISNYITKIDTVLTDESLQYTDYQVGGDFGQ